VIRIAIGQMRAVISGATAKAIHSAPNAIKPTTEAANQISSREQR